jgi:uncharacterized membrane protein YeaQ/YmgE (transglycosylase-associated protein family)
MTLAVVGRVVLDPGNVLAWIIVGLLAGAIAGRLVAGRGFGCLADIAVGIIGAFIGGFVISLFVGSGAFGFIGSILVAILGATIFLALLRLVSGGRL